MQQAVSKLLLPQHYRCVKVFSLFFFGTSFRIFNKRMISSNPIIILFVFGCSDHWLR